MTEEFYVVAIAALLPVTAAMLVTQVNPYHALVIRGIVGALAALIYALFGAADVALTEALVGTMLSITLYAIAVRSSMSLRLGVLEGAAIAQPAVAALRQTLDKHHLRLELLPFPSENALQNALLEKDIHAFCLPTSPTSPGTNLSAEVTPVTHHLTCRLQRLYEILEAGLPPGEITVSYAPPGQSALELPAERLDQVTLLEGQS